MELENVGQEVIANSKHFEYSIERNIKSYNAYLEYNQNGMLEDICRNKTIEICKEKCAAHAQELIDELNNL